MPTIQYKIIGGAVLLLVAYFVLRGWGDAAKSITKAAVNTAGGAVAGVVEGVGEIVGIPVTNLSECELAIKEGRTLAASAHCSAPRFINYLRTGK